MESVFPNIKFSSIKLENHSSSITLELENNETNSFRELLKYFKIKIIQIKNKKDYTLITTTNKFDVVITNNKIFEINENKIINLKFDITKDEEFLGYVFYPFIDLQQLKSDYNLIFSDEAIEGDARGKITSLIAIENFDLADNSVTQDLRVSEKIGNINLDFTDAINFKANVNKNFVNNYFSELLFSRDDKGNGNFLFFVDLNKILLNNSSFSSFFLKEEPNFNILSLKLLRKRIAGSPQTGSKPNSTIVSKFEELLVQSGDKNNQFLSVDNNNASIKEIRNINLKSHLRCFTGTDKTVFFLNDGYYVYSAELEIEDTSLNLLNNLFASLTDARRRLEIYYSDAIKNQTIINNSNPHIDFPGETSWKLGDVKLVNFNETHNKFVQSFIDEQNSKYSKSIASWAQGIEIYEKILSLFSKVSFSEKTKMAILNQIKPETGSPTNILKLINVFHTIENKISSISGNLMILNNSYFSPNGIKNQKASLPNKGRSTSGIKKIKISNNFKFVVNSAIKKEKGFDFLDTESLEKEKGLKFITKDSYLDRVNRETDHYFNKNGGKNPDININFQNQNFTTNDSLENTNFSYMSPAKINLDKNQTIQRLGHSPTPKLNDSILNKIEASSTNVKNIPVELNNKIFNTNNFKNSLNKNIDPVDDSIFCNVEETKPEIKNNIQVLMNVINDKSKINIKDFDISNKNNILNKVLSDTTLKSSDSFFQGKPHHATLNDALTNLPNQIKSLFLNKTNKTIVKDNLSEQNITKFKLDYHSLVGVQLLVGFETDKTGKELLNELKWQPLTKEIYNNNLNKILICRMKKYENKIIGIINAISDPIYDEYFLLEAK